MRKIYLKYFLTIVSINLSLSMFSQTVIWSEDFDGNGGTGSNWGTLNQAIGGQGNLANEWYVSCRENGEGVGNCGCDCNAGCGANNLTLHLGSTTAGDIGAAYDAGGFCGFGLCTNTNKRSQSVNISTVGQSNLTLNYLYMENGQGASDNCITEYSVDGGATWTLLIDPAKTAICLGGQGTWTSASIALPAACDNIANLRIAFVWQNNDDAIGSDPSFAVDDITITKPLNLPVELVNFSANYNGFNTQLRWTTFSENNNDYFLIEKSEDGINWKSIGRLKGMEKSSSRINYSFIDEIVTKIDLTDYYRLKQVDFNGKFYYSETIKISKKGELNFLIYPNPANQIINIKKINNSIHINQVNIANQYGVIVYSKNIINDNNIDVINVSDYKKGVYYIQLKSYNGNLISKKLIVK